MFLITEHNNQELKQALANVGGALINFGALNQEIKIILMTIQNEQIVCKIPSDQNKILTSLKQIIQCQKILKQHQEQRMGQGQQPVQVINPQMLQQGQVIMQ